LDLRIKETFLLLQKGQVEIKLVRELKSIWT
jgi:hypothetical protein